MGTCQYEHEGKKTCNIDTSLFKDSSQEDLFPDFCYFHGVDCVFQKIYLTLNTFITDIQHEDIAQGFKNLKITMIYTSLTMGQFPELLQCLPPANIFYANFDKLMSRNDVVIVDTSGFYFPVKSSNDVNLNSDNVPKTWNTKLILTDYKLYNLDLIERYKEAYAENNISYLRDSSKVLGIDDDDDDSLGFIDNRNNIKKIKLNITNITFNNVLEIITDSPYDYIFSNCILNSFAIDINVNNVNFIDKTYVTNANQNFNITTTNCLIKNSKIESKEIIIKASSLNIEYTDLHSDNTEKIELHVPFNRLTLQNPFSKKKLFGEKALVDIYDV